MIVILHLDRELMHVDIGRVFEIGRIHEGPTRAEQIDMAELYVPFSWHEAIWLEAHGIAEPGEG